MLLLFVKFSEWSFSNNFHGILIDLPIHKFYISFYAQKNKQTIKMALQISMVLKWKNAFNWKNSLIILLIRRRDTSQMSKVMLKSYAFIWKDILNEMENCCHECDSNDYTQLFIVYTIVVSLSTQLMPKNHAKHKCTQHSININIYMNLKENVSNHKWIDTSISLKATIVFYCNYKLARVQIYIGWIAHSSRMQWINGSDSREIQNMYVFRCAKIRCGVSVISLKNFQLKFHIFWIDSVACDCTSSHYLQIYRHLDYIKSFKTFSYTGYAKIW